MGLFAIRSDDRVVGQCIWPRRADCAPLAGSMAPAPMDDSPPRSRCIRRIPSRLQLRLLLYNHHVGQHFTHLPGRISVFGEKSLWPV